MGEVIAVNIKEVLCGIKLACTAPEQRYRQVLDKLLHCAEYGTELG